MSPETFSSPTNRSTTFKNWKDWKFENWKCENCRQERVHCQLSSLRPLSLHGHHAAHFDWGEVLSIALSPMCCYLIEFFFHYMVTMPLTLIGVFFHYIVACVRWRTLWLRWRLFHHIVTYVLLFYLAGVSSILLSAIAHVPLSYWGEVFTNQFITFNF